MPYAPGIQYQGADYLYQGISQFGKNFADAIDKRRKQKQLDAINDAVINSGVNSGDVSRDQLEEYQGLSGNKKSDFAAGIAADMHDRWQRQLQKSEVDLRKAEADKARQQIAEGNWQPSWEQQQAARATGNELLPVGRGKFAAVPYGGGGGNEPVITDPLKVGDREVPGIGVNRKTGQYIYFKDSGLERDPETGALGSRDTKGNFKPLTAAQITGMMTDPNNPQNQPSPTPTPGPGFISRISGGAAPSPTPAPGAPAAAVPAAVPAGPRAPAPTGKARVISPQGVPGLIPAERLQDYINAGYTQG